MYRFIGCNSQNVRINMVQININILILNNKDDVNIINSFSQHVNQPRIFIESLINYTYNIILYCIFHILLWCE